VWLFIVVFLCGCVGFFSSPFRLVWGGLFAILCFSMCLWGLGGGFWFVVCSVWESGGFGFLFLFFLFCVCFVCFV